MIPIILWIAQLFLIPVVSPLCIGIVRKLKAHFQSRVGADIFQPYRDLRKLFGKDETVSEDASWIFRFAPYLIFGVTLIVGANIPIFASPSNGNVAGDLLVVVYLLMLGTFFLALAGMDTGSAFGGFGSSREMTIAALSEGGLFFSMLVPGILAGTTNLFSVAAFISAVPLVALAPVLLAFIAFVIVMLAETARFPFDNPATHLELTMIHEAMILEYSGKRLALIEWASANKLLIFLTLGANLFFPWGFTISLNPADIAIALVFYVAKIVLLCGGIAILESVTAKFRFFRLPDLLLSSFILSVISIILIV